MFDLGLQFDGVAVHWYDVGADTFETYVTSFHDAFNMDIWVTEYACQVRPTNSSSSRTF